jgi:enoyl-[acyl-carrier protein] reductase III
MIKNNKYALILGSSSGFGKATSIELASNGYNIYGVHLDYGAGKKNAEDICEVIKSKGVKVLFFNMNAADDTNRKEVILKIKDDFKSENDAKIDVFLHSLAFGTLGPLVSSNTEEQLDRKKIEMTMNVMANSLLFWVQDLFNENLIRSDSRIFAMTSAGSLRATKNYGAVSAAKAALEAYIRQVAGELAPYGITANCILAGPTDTPAAQKIPGFEKMLRISRERSPHKRNTEPVDVAKSIALLADPGSYWINGQIIDVDGGENIYNDFE